MGGGWAGHGISEVDSQETSVTPEDRNKLAQLPHQAFSRLLLCLWATLSSPSLPLSYVPTPTWTCGETKRPPSLRQVRGAPEQKSC